MKISFFDVPKEENIIFSNLLNGFEVYFYEEKLSEENVNLTKETEILSVFVGSEIRKKLIDLMPK